MRIVLLSVSAQMGGSEASLLELVYALRQRAAPPAVTVIVPREGPLAARVRAAGADVRILPMPDALARFGEWGLSGGTAIGRHAAALMRAVGPLRAYTRGLRRLIVELDPDVVHSNGLKLHLLAARALPPGVPLVWHVHEYIAARPLTRRLLRRARHRPAAMIANSRSVEADVRQALDASVPVETVYNAVDLDRFHPAGAAADLDRLSGLPPAPAGTVRVGLVATFGRWKGHDTFLDALARIDRSRLRAYIVGGALYETVGSQYSIDELRAAAAAAGLGTEIGFTGFVEDSAPVMRALDIVVHASTHPEPFGLVIAEAMACARAVIVSGSGGATELVDEGVDAVTFPSGDADALAATIARLAADAPLRRRLGAAAREAAVMRFGRSAFGDRMMQVYARVGADRRVVA